jgi:hypothetical protein
MMNRSATGDSMTSVPSAQGQQGFRPGTGAPASAVIWDWRGAPQNSGGGHVKPLVLGRALRDFAIGAAAALVLYLFRRPVFALVVLAIAGLVLTIALVSPDGLHRRLRGWLAAFALGVGRVVTVVVLALVYFTVFLLVRVVRAATGTDSLKVKRQDASTTHWITRTAAGDTPPDRPY